MVVPPGTPMYRKYESEGFENAAEQIRHRIKGLPPEINLASGQAAMALFGASAIAARLLEDLAAERGVKPEDLLLSVIADLDAETS